MLLSRLTDETEAVQPTRALWLTKYGTGQGDHDNSVQSWAIDAAGSLGSGLID